MTAILYRMAQGIPGDVSRQSIATIEAQPLNAAAPFLSYGIPGKIAAGLFVPLSAVGDTAPYGFLVRPYPITGANASDPLGTAVPLTSGLANILRRGYMTVQSNAGTPTAQGTVYVRYANAAAGTPIGGLEATSVGGSNVALLGVAFMGPADASGNVEIAFNI
jgi:hypothetical protein